jgi:hypothetical protein
MKGGASPLGILKSQMFNHTCCPTSSSICFRVLLACFNTIFHTQICLGDIPTSPLFHLCAFLNTYTTCTWKTMHLVKLQHSNLPHNLGLFLIFKWVGLQPVADFLNGLRPFHLGLPFLVFPPNCRLRLV